MAKMSQEEKEAAKKKRADEKKEDKKAFTSFKDLVRRAKEKGALVELILPEGETID
jgi:hypothetical protein